MKAEDQEQMAQALARLNGEAPEELELNAQDLSFQDPVDSSEAEAVAVASTEAVTETEAVAAAWVEEISTLSIEPELTEIASPAESQPEAELSEPLLES
jgi:hypothetical protein